MELLTPESAAHFFLMLALLFIAICVVEGTVLRLFRINRFQRALVQSVGINFVSLVIGLGLVFLIRLSAFSDLRFDSDPAHIPFWLSTWLVLVVVEGVLIRLFNKNLAWERAFMASIVMNALSFAGLYLIALL